MKINLSRTTRLISARRIPLGLILAVAGIFLRLDATAIPAAVNLGTSGSFAVLAGSGITVAGAVNSTTITGDIGTFPTPSITGLGNVVLNGVNHAGDAVTQNAKTDLVIAYNDASGRIATTTYDPIFDLGGLILTSGVYKGASSLGITGTLKLDANGNPNAVWIFQAGSSLDAASHSKVVLLNGAQACHVFWVVTSSATLGTDAAFVGNILALQSITLDTGATVDGRVLARNGAVTLDYNTLTKSVCISGGTGDTGGGGTALPEGGGTLLLLGTGLAALATFKRRFAVAA